MPANSNSNSNSSQKDRYIDVGEGLADCLRRHTHPYHQQAERGGILQEILQGRADRAAYALLMRNLLPAYQQLETGLERHRQLAVIGPLAVPAVYRAAAIATDLKALFPQSAIQDLPLLPAAQIYAERIALIADANASVLIAHAYTRFLGDLNGGQILRRLLSKTLQLEAAALTFYDYPELDTEQFKNHYRQHIDDVARCVSDIGSVVEEAILAFQLNIGLSEAVKQAVNQSSVQGVRK
ncbi:MAG: biliverdin-producing heme oxygenase [Gammaproteobacteria bacterium]|nr:biliverdin-producing heme oxygenase [Pseudomonadales bacterium]